MRFTEKTCVMDAAGIDRALARIAAEIVERNRGTGGLVLVGIRRRGVPLAERIAAKIGLLERAAPPVAALDIAFYGDDLSTVGPQPIVRESPLPGELEGATAVLVDDVLYTGRTVYAALDHLLANARPRRVELAALVDRGHRELPVHADYTGRVLATRASEIVKVMLAEFDGEERAIVVEPLREDG